MSERLPPGLAGHASETLGQDFSNVSVHEDGEAERLGTLAFARGDSLHFAKGSYDPSSKAGVALIGHELGHVAQQRAGRVAKTGTAKGVAVNTDPSLEADADASGAAVAQGFDLEGTLGPARPAAAGGVAPRSAPDAAAPSGFDLEGLVGIAQGSDLAADEETGPAEEPVAVDVELADVLGADYESTRDANEQDLWAGTGELEAVMDQLRAKSPNAAAALDAELASTNTLPRDIEELEEQLLASAHEGEDGSIVVDPEVEIALLQAVDEMLVYADIYRAERKYWGLVLAIPDLELAEKLMQGWIAILENADKRLQIALASRTRLDAMYTKWKTEFHEACAKVGIDAASLVADLLLLTLPVSLPVTLAGLAVTMGGVGLGMLIEPGEKTQPQSIFNGVVATTDMLHGMSPDKLPKFVSLATVNELKRMGVGGDLVKGFNFGILTDVGSLAADSAEAALRKQMVDEIGAALAEWSSQWGGLLAAMPEVFTMLGAANTFLTRIQEALANKAPLLEAALDEVRTARADLG